MRQALCGLRFLHDNLVVHRDLKGANILLATDGVSAVPYHRLGRGAETGGEVGRVTGAV